MELGHRQVVSEVRADRRHELVEPQSLIVFRSVELSFMVCGLIADRDRIRARDYAFNSERCGQWHPARGSLVVWAARNRAPSLLGELLWGGGQQLAEVVWRSCLRPRGPGWAGS